MSSNDKTTKEGGGKEEDECSSEETEEDSESSDTGFATSLTSVNSELESTAGKNLETDCSAISNFFGYW